MKERGFLFKNKQLNLLEIVSIGSIFGDISNLSYISEEGVYEIFYFEQESLSMANHFMEDGTLRKLFGLERVSLG